MNPILDQVLVGALIVVALLYFLFRKKDRCGAGCDCSATKRKKP